MIHVCEIQYDIYAFIQRDECDGDWLMYIYQ